MDECIKREAAIKRIQEIYCVGCNSYHGVRCRACGTGDAIDIIEDFPAVDVAPVVHGRWEYIPQTFNTLSQLRCPFCRWWSLDPSIDGAYNYCPNCGAKMDGGADNETD